MPGKNFKQGYACQMCIDEDKRRPTKRPPLYIRELRQMVFSGLVVCPTHGVMKGVALKDLK